jgi:glycosyltransferase involved in cell wall biosynthesis
MPRLRSDVDDVPLRLLLLIDSLDIGGAERHVVDLATALQARGHEVTVGVSALGPLAGELRAASVEVMPLARHPVKRRMSPSYALSVRRLVRSRRFDLVHAHLYASAAAARAALVGFNMPLLVTEHTEGVWQGRAARVVARTYLRRADHIISVSGGIRDRLVHDLGVSRSRLSVVPNAVPPLRTGDRSSAPHVGPLVGVVARLCPEKGVDLFLDAVAQIASRHPHASFVIAGDGPLRRQLQSQASRLGLAQRVRFLGELADGRTFISTLYLLVVPSRTEGTPLVVLEAQSAGVPIVAARIGGVPAQVRHGIDGILVSPHDPGELAFAIDRLLASPEALQRLVPRVGEQLDMHMRMVLRVEALYRRMALGQAVREPGSQVLLEV